MKKLLIILSAGVVIMSYSCDGVRRDPGLVYMPDMAYSRAYETYMERDSNVFTMDAADPGDKIFYNNQPVAGTIARGEELPFLPKDAFGDSANYVASKAVPNPLPALNAKEMTEAQRLYLVNCAICHGTALDGNGPLYNEGQGPFPAAPKNFVDDPTMIAMPEGQMFYSVTYGKNLMGSYASQLSRKQRWMIISYIKSKQAATEQASGSMATATTDSSANSATKQ
jgi:mono/diheme cytochrome c family protein